MKRDGILLYDVTWRRQCGSKKGVKARRRLGLHLVFSHSWNNASLAERREHEGDWDVISHTRFNSFFQEATAESERAQGIYSRSLYEKLLYSITHAIRHYRLPCARKAASPNAICRICLVQNTHSAATSQSQNEITRFSAAGSVHQPKLPHPLRVHACVLAALLGLLHFLHIWRARRRRCCDLSIL